MLEPDGGRPVEAGRRDDDGSPAQRRQSLGEGLRQRPWLGEIRAVDGDPERERAGLGRQFGQQLGEPVRQR